MALACSPEAFLALIAFIMFLCGLIVIQLVDNEKEKDDA